MEENMYRCRAFLLKIENLSEDQVCEQNDCVPRTLEN
jgi:hypothetical protein